MALGASRRKFICTDIITIIAITSYANSKKYFASVSFTL
jgi:hypothetical protein